MHQHLRQHRRQHLRQQQRQQQRQHQRGIVLMIALIMLVAMTLGGIALIRTVFTSSLIASNLSFQQASTTSADAGVEAAVTWLEQNKGVALQSNSAANGYSAKKEDPMGTQTWAEYWVGLQAANSVVTLPAADAAGNTASYVIHRLCNGTGAPTSGGTQCAASPSTQTGTNSSQSAGSAILAPGTLYYRITTRVSGPRGSVSFVQAIVGF